MYHIKNFKIQKGVTLIALIITIIVLLILAVVSFNVLLGDNGLINRARQSSIQYDIAETLEKIKLDTNARSIEKLGEAVTNREIREFSKKYGELSNDDILTTKKGNKVDIKQLLVPRLFITEWTLDAGDTLYLPISTSKENNFIVDWGDGSEKEHIVNNQDLPSHTYATAGVYQVSMEGKCMYITISQSEKEDLNFPLKLTKLISWGEMETKRYSFSGAENLSGEIPEPLGDTFYYVKDFDSLFNKCKNITTINSKLFKNIQGDVTSFEKAFANCENLKFVPENLFENATGVKSFRHTFYGCESLTTVPEGLFSKNTEVTDFSGVFKHCYNFTTIPSGLFKYNTKVVNFAESFRHCEELTGVPKDLFIYNTEVETFEATFYDCDSLTTVSENLFDNNQKATIFRYTFYDANELLTGPKLWERTTEGIDGVGCYGDCPKFTYTVPTPWNALET